ncbi:DUF5719 family protein [Nocardiopsis sp. MG754419]|uniref:DUF5719 family protein n=1 Tax=Nocardiopsis sp. MG754419 TaxID=2259865 RepID=UPI001BA8E428|nr:DUF5719 family protein [Nocardiopsis sp. MG754419]MBR8741330.1 hypothetical protein [Nocardiopsis sp. MG754419]
MRLIVENRFALFGLVALALLALFGVAFAIRPISPELGVSEPGTVRPESAARVCPAPHASEDDGAESSVAAFAPRVGRDDEGALWAVPVTQTTEEDAEDEDEDAEDEDADDDEDAARESPGGSDEDADERGALLGEELTEPGRVWRTDTGDVTLPTALNAEGSLASGLDAAQTTVSDDAVTEVRCVEPGIGTWFALPGAGGADGVALDTLTVHLSNPEEFRATTSIDIYTAEGPSYSPDSRGIHLGPGESTTVDVTELIQNTSSLGVHVRTSTGRVAASLLAEHTEGHTDWVAPTSAPDVAHVIPGLPGGDGVRRLVVAAPGDAPVEVRAHVVPGERPENEDEDDEETDEDGNGAGTPDDPMVLNVPPAASAWMTLESALGGLPGTVVVEADAPVVVGMIIEEAGSGGGDADVVETAYTAAVDPLTGPLNGTAVIPDMPEGVDVEVILGAPDSDARVVATPIAADGSMGDAVRAEVAAGTTHVFGTETDGWGPPAGIDPEDGYAVRLEVLEDSGPVYAARVLRSGSGISVLPVRPAPTEIRLPVVRDSVTGVVP